MRVQAYFRNGLYEYLDLWYGASHAEDKAIVKDLGAVMWGPLTPAPEPPAEEN